MDLAGADEDAVAILAFEIALTLNGTIVLAILVVELDADPNTWRKGGLTDEEHLAVTKVGHLDTRVQVERLRCGHGALIRHEAKLGRKRGCSCAHADFWQQRRGSQSMQPCCS